MLIRRFKLYREKRFCNNHQRETWHSSVIGCEECELNRIYTLNPEPELMKYAERKLAKKKAKH